MIIHGSEDNIVPMEMGKRILTAASEPKQGVFLPGGGHEIFAFKAASKVIKFLDQYLAD